MLAAFITNPLQGSVFRRMRDIVRGVTPFTIEECDENYRKMSKITIGTRSDVSNQKPSYAQIAEGGNDVDLNNLLQVCHKFNFVQTVNT